MSNIDQFNYCAAQILGYLYLEFPMESTVEISRFPYYDQFEMSELFYATVEYLNNEGFIKYSFSQYGGYSNVILTAEGLYVLSSNDEQLSGEKTIGEKLNLGISKIPLTEISALMRVLLKLFIAVK